MNSVWTSITTLASVIDLVIKLEKHGRDFYAEVRDTTSDPDCKELFSWLVEQEDDHHTLYLELKSKVMGAAQPEAALIGGHGHFIEMLVREVTESLTIDDKTGLEEAIEGALFFEESVVSYFQKVKTLFAAEQAGVLEEICAEEQQHIDAILKYKAELHTA